MNAVSEALRLEPVPPMRELLAILDPSTGAALKTLLPIRPLLLLLSDIQNLVRNRVAYVLLYLRDYAAAASDSSP